MGGFLYAHIPQVPGGGQEGDRGDAAPTTGSTQGRGRRGVDVHYVRDPAQEVRERQG